MGFCRSTFTFYFDRTQSFPLISFCRVVWHSDLWSTDLQNRHGYSSLFKGILSYWFISVSLSSEQTSNLNKLPLKHPVQKEKAVKLKCSVPGVWTFVIDLLMIYQRLTTSFINLFSNLNLSTVDSLFRISVQVLSKYTIILCDDNFFFIFNRDIKVNFKLN